MNWRPLVLDSGFEDLARISNPPLRVFWNPRRKIELHVMDFDSCAFVRGAKTYYLKALSEEGELHAKDLEPTLEWFETHFPVLRIHFGYFRDISHTLAIARIREKNFRETGPDFDPDRMNERLSETKTHFEQLKQQIDDNASLRRLDSFSFMKTPGLTGMLQQEEGRLRQKAANVAEEGKRLGRYAGVAEALMKEYGKHGSAVSVVICVGTDCHWANSEGEFRDAFAAIIKELEDLHQFQVRQKLSHGKFQIPVMESTDPSLDWLALWSGGYPSPIELERWGQSFEEFRKKIESRFMVTPVRDIVVGGVRDQKKLVVPRIVRAFLERLPRVKRVAPADRDLPRKGRLVWIGNVMEGDVMTDTPFMLPLDDLIHCYISGRSGSGKSYLLRVLIEGAILHSINVLLLDAGNQGAGLMFPEDRKEILARYPEFGLDESDAQGFEAKYYAPGLGLGLPLPEDLATLAQGVSIVSFKGLGETERNDCVSRILERVFEKHSEQESDRLETLEVVDEAQRYTPRRQLHGETSKGAAVRAENQLDLHGRESRKHGLNLVCCSQTIRDFSHSAATIRQNMNTKCFLGNSDREVDYASGYLADGSEIVELRPGEAIIFNPLWGEVKVRVRPPFSKVREIPIDVLKQALDPNRRRGEKSRLTPEEVALLRVAKAHLRESGEYINVGTAAERMGITSKRRMHALVEGLARRGRIRLKTGQGRGQPKLIIPADHIAD